MRKQDVIMYRMLGYFAAVAALAMFLTWCHG